MEKLFSRHGQAEQFFGLPLRVSIGTGTGIPGGRREKTDISFSSLNCMID